MTKEDVASGTAYPFKWLETRDYYNALAWSIAGSTLDACEVDSDIQTAYAFIYEWPWSKKLIPRPRRELDHGKAKTFRRKHYDETCAQCKTALATEADHIIPLSEGGTDTEDNLQMLCHECHLLKTHPLRRERQSLAAERLFQTTHCVECGSSRIVYSNDGEYPIAFCKKHLPED